VAGRAAGRKGMEREGLESRAMLRFAEIGEREGRKGICTINIILLYIPMFSI
jgi:hypothetical protein